jgi:holin-like protein
VLFQLIGTALNAVFPSTLPGPIIGMLLMFIFIWLRGEVGQPITSC